jgi:hypothetical protein
MGAPYSPPPLWPAFVGFGGLVIWGYLCGRVRSRIVGLLCLPLPFVGLGIYFPGVLSQIRAVVNFVWLSLLFSLPGYLAGFFHGRRKADGHPLNTRETLPSGISSVLRFLLFLLYAAAFFVSVLHHFGHSFPSGYIFAAIFVGAAAVLYGFLRRKVKLGIQ